MQNVSNLLDPDDGNGKRECTRYSCRCSKDRSKGNTGGTLLKANGYIHQWHSRDSVDIDVPLCGCHLILTNKIGIWMYPFRQDMNSIYSLSHSFDLRQIPQQTLPSSWSYIRVLSSLVFAKPVSSFRASIMDLAGYPWLFLPWVGSHKTNEDAGSSGCLREWPASSNLHAATLSQTLGRSP